MAAVKKTRNQNGYGEKMTVKIVTVDKEKRRVEGSTRDGAMIYIAIWETGTVFRWPEVGEVWTVRKDTGIWRLDQLVQTELAESESEAVPKTLEELPEGDTRIVGETVHVNNITINGTQDHGLVTQLPAESVVGDTCTIKGEGGVFWRFLKTEEPTYPWAFIGGGSLAIEEPTSYAISAAAYTFYGTTMALTVPVKGIFDMAWGIRAYSPTVNAAVEVALSYNGAVEEAYRIDTFNAAANSGAGGDSTTHRKELTSAGIIVREVVAVPTAVASTIERRWLQIRPVRVG